jgi:hypothetical protein
VDHRSDVGLVDAHTVGRSAAEHAVAAVEEPVLDLGLLVPIEAGVVEANGMVPES